MKATINGITVEGTPAEIVEYRKVCELQQKQPSQTQSDLLQPYFLKEYNDTVRKKMEGWFTVNQGKKCTGPCYCTGACMGHG